MMESLVFVDESGINLSLDRRYGRAIGGERGVMPTPYYRTENYSLLSAITSEKVLSALYGAWSTNGECFLQWLEDALCPPLEPHHKVLMDNVSFHKVEGVSKAIESTGAELIYLPPYSPDFSPIENMWSTLKTLLRSYAASTAQQLQKALKKAFEAITSDDLYAWYQHCGYSI